MLESLLILREMNDAWPNKFGNIASHLTVLEILSTLEVLCQSNLFKSMFSKHVNFYVILISIPPERMFHGTNC
jgi:hypothetical protein